MRRRAMIAHVRHVNMVVRGQFLGDLPPVARAGKKAMQDNQRVIIRVAKFLKGQLHRPHQATTHNAPVNLPAKPGTFAFNCISSNQISAKQAVLFQPFNADKFIFCG